MHRSSIRSGVERAPYCRASEAAVAVGTVWSGQSKCYQQAVAAILFRAAKRTPWPASLCWLLPEPNGHASLTGRALPDGRASLIGRALPDGSASTDGRRRAAIFISSGGWTWRGPPDGRASL